MTNSGMFGIRVRCKSRSLLAGALFFLGIGVVILQTGWTPIAMTQENVVMLNVAVIERDPQAFGSLTKEEFTVYEDGVKQEINSLSAQEAPVSLGIAIDASGSMREQLPLIQRAALSVISQLRPIDEAFVVAFKAEPELVQGFTNNQRTLANAIGQIYTSGGTALLDAVVATGDYVNEKGKHRRKALLFITDGMEKNSTVKENKVITGLIENQAQAYFLCLPGKDTQPYLRNMTPSKARELLDRLAKATGGLSFPLSTPEESAQTATRLMEILLRQYEITYVPTNNKQDDLLRKVSVVVSPKDGRQLTVITRQGYYGPGHKRAAEKEAGKKKK